MRPRKLRLEVETHTSPGAKTPMCRPMQGPHPGVPMVAPASRRVRRVPSLAASSRTWELAGTTRSRTQGATFLPLSTSAAALRSSMRPLVQVPMKTWSTLLPLTWATSWTLST